MPKRSNHRTGCVDDIILSLEIYYLLLFLGSIREFINIRVTCKCFHANRLKVYQCKITGGGWIKRHRSGHLNTVELYAVK